MTTLLSVHVEAQLGALQLDVRFETEGPVVLTGVNGAGKSSTLALILGLLTPSRGAVRLGTRTLFDSHARVDVPVEGRRLGFVPQSDALLPNATVVDNLALPMRWRFGKADPAAILQLLEEFGVAHLAARRPGTLSGGERQRVALARALCVAPEALLLDEPLAALDAQARLDLRQTLREALRRRRLPAVIVTHDPLDVAALSDRVLTLAGGRVTPA